MAYYNFLDTSNASISLLAAGESTYLTGLAVSVDTAGELIKLNVGSNTVWSGYMDPTAAPFCARFPENIPVPDNTAVTIVKENAGTDVTGTLFYEG